MLRKTLFIILLTFVLSTVVILIGVSQIIKRGTNVYIEQEKVKKQEAVTVYFDDQFRNLMILTKAHAYWSTASQAIASEDDVWITENLTDYLVNGDFHIDFVFISSEDKTYTNILGIERESIINSNIYEQVLTEDVISESLLEINDSIYIITGLPFTDDDRSNPNGVLLLGRAFDEVYQQDLQVYTGDLHQNHMIFSTSSEIDELHEYEMEQFAYETMDDTVYISAHFEYSFTEHLSTTIRNHIIVIIITTVIFVTIVVFVTINLFRKQVTKIINQLEKIDIQSGTFEPLNLTATRELNLIIETINTLGVSVVESLQKLIEKNLEIVELLVVASEINDPYTKSHGDTVAKIAVILGKALQIDTLHQLERAAKLHDIGKVFLDNNILNKPSTLSNSEFNLVMQHPIHGAKLVETIKQFDKISEAILHHHERFDGTGYPDNLKGHDIPLFARIIAIADVFDAITSDRPYRKAISSEKVLEIMTKGQGTLFDPEILDIFLDYLKTHPELYQNYPNTQQL